MTLFTKILKREIPAQIVYEDEQCFAIRDINPQAPVHVLLIPKIEIPSLNDVKDEHCEVLGHLMSKVHEIAEKEGVAEHGYRLVVNTGAQAGMTVPHLHLHIIGGRALNWPPG